jgi:hypothetical protein
MGTVQCSASTSRRGFPHAAPPFFGNGTNVQFNGCWIWCANNEGERNGHERYQVRRVWRCVCRGVMVARDPCLGTQPPASGRPRVRPSRARKVRE